MAAADGESSTQQDAAQPFAAADLMAVLTTVGDREQAQRLGEAVVRRRLAACAQISAIDSICHWQGGLQRVSEWRSLFKTTAARHAALCAALQERHPYELPQIVAWPLAFASEPYAQWVREQTGESF